TRVARAALLPQLNAVASADRAKTSLNSPLYSATRPDIGNDFVAGLDLSWELDLFGRLRSAAAAARATAEATAGDAAALELRLRAELATDYFALRALDADVELLGRTVEDYGRALELTQHLYRGGAAALADVQQSTAQLAGARTQLEDARLRRAQAEHAIAVLMGRPPALFHLEPRPLAVTATVPVVGAALPSQLLERRPDIAAAERRVASANAAIGVARAAYFPVFSLSGVLGRESDAGSTWFEAPSRFWAAGAQGALAVFDAGRRRALSAGARAAYEEQVAHYRATVLTAYQEVEDNLAALRQLEREADSARAAVAATQGALEQANYRYRAGVVTYLEVVATENAALAARLAEVDIQSRRLTASVLLVRALGGDWEVPAAAPSGPGAAPGATDPR
ncbi:MAG: efflux transporter outer membrane subunit, partial [Proteobacteria bacterium]|nr:efflux transporter outer membrane subunit [Pseudomonadota bacterium]